MLSGHLYEAASASNVEYLFSGFGGDEGISSRATGVFYDFRMQGEFRILREELFQYYRLKQRKQYSALLRYLLIRYFPAVEKQFFNRLHSRDPFREYVGRMAIQKEFVEGRAAKERFVLLKEFHLGKSMLENQFFRLSHNHVSQRLEYSSMDAAARGIQYLYPLFDVDLVSFYLRLPTSYKFSNGRGRAIFREALRPYLPDEIRNREVKSIPTIPTVYQRVYNDYETLKELIKRSRDFSFQYLDPDKMLSWLERIRGGRSAKRVPLHPMAFLNSIQVLLLQEMQKNGEYNSGIRC
jgi:asparagine synthetase B (glutamine-hydrolysing)